jgi:hypothetical protein
MATRVDLALSAALRDTAEALTGVARLRERDLRTCFQERLAACLEQRQTACEVDASELAVDLREWPGVGCADIVVRDPLKEPFVCFELKCGSGTLYNCVWDLAKLGVIVARGVAARAFLVAAAPAIDWYGSSGSELFATREWEASSLLEAYRKHWEFWKRDVKTHPMAIPALVETSLFADEELVVADAPWFLRVAEVTATPEDWLDVQSEIRVSRWLTHFTWKAGDVEFLTAEEAAKILDEDVSEETHPD